MAVEEAEERDVLALSGLRRMVLHARDRLVETRPTPQWTYDHDSWKPGQVRRYAAQLLAEEVLTLVAECIPGGETLSADEAAQRAQAAVDARAEQERRHATEVTAL